MFSVTRCEHGCYNRDFKSSNRVCSIHQLRACNVGLFLLSKPLYFEQLFRLNIRQKNSASSELEGSQDLTLLSTIVFGWSDPSTSIRSDNTQGEPGGIEALRLDSQLDFM